MGLYGDVLDVGNMIGTLNNSLALLPSAIYIPFTDFEMV
jgi:hypothetical protein